MRDLRSTYHPRTVPFVHQWDALQASYNKRAFALLMDPGLGKTKVILDNVAILFDHGSITGLLILAPNDVHTQWIKEQIPEHMPRHIHIRSMLWQSQAQGRMKKELAAICKPLPGYLHILSMNHEALATSRGRAAARFFLKAHKVFFALDESHEFRTPAAARTRALYHLKDYAVVRRIITGTLTGGTPFHLYSQFNFLDIGILNCKSYLAFKHRYAEWADQMVLGKKIDPVTNKRKPQVYEELLGYKDLDELNNRIAPFVYSKKKEDCEGLPPKIYETVPTHLSAAQVAVYNSLAEEALTLLDLNEQGKLSAKAVSQLEELEEEDLLARVIDPRGRMSYRIKLTMWLRLQQCTAGIVKDDAGTVSWIDEEPGKCPRIKAACTWVERALTSNTKVIVWANFRPILEALAGELNKISPTILVHGGITGKHRAAAIEQFKSSKGPRVLAAHPRTLGTGNNFEIASYVLYYTRSFSFFQRKQSEDRAHRLSSRGTVTVGDMIAHNSGTDEKELLSMQAKQDVVAQLETFNMRELIQC